MVPIEAMWGAGRGASLVRDGTTTVVGEGETALPDPLSAPAFSSDPGAELAALAVQSGEEQENVVEKARDTEVEVEVHEDSLQVDALRKKADDIRASGIWEGVGMCVEGASALLPAVTSVSSRTADAIKAGGKVASGGAFLASTFRKAGEANDEAVAAAAKSDSDRARGAADDLGDAKKSAGDLISAALDFYREYVGAQAAANTAAIHRA